MNYSKEFKEEALKLSDEIGLKKAAAQLGIKYYTLFSQKTGRSKNKRTSPVHPRTQRKLYCKRDVQGTENQRIGLLQMAEKSQQTYQTAASSGRDQQRSFCS